MIGRRSFLRTMLGGGVILPLQAQPSQKRLDTTSPSLRRLNPTFYGVPYVSDVEKLEADVAFVGIPFDLGTCCRPGARYGPSGLREASPRQFTEADFDPKNGWYDYELDDWFLKDVRLADIGDINIMAADFGPNLDRITEVIGKVLSRGAFPAILGGDHAITFPVVRAFRGTAKKIHIIHFDSHHDFWEGQGPAKYNHANPMRRSFELEWVSGVTSVGLRGITRNNKDFEEGRQMGVQMIPALKALQMGAKETVAKIKQAESYYISFDVDVIDPSLSPATGTPVPGGFSYYQAREILTEIAKKGQIVGFDFVEVAPEYDFAETTARLTARLIMDFLGAIFKYKKAS